MQALNLMNSHLYDCTDLVYGISSCLNPVGNVITSLILGRSSFQTWIFQRTDIHKLQCYVTAAAVIAVSMVATVFAVMAAAVSITVAGAAMAVATALGCC